MIQPAMLRPPGLYLNTTLMTNLWWKGAVTSLHFHGVFIVLSVVAGGF